MVNLIHSEFSRLLKSASFLASTLVVIFMALFGVFSDLINKIVLPSWYADYNNDDSLFNGTMYAVIIVSAFISAFLGTEFSDGTIRNKIIAGHTHSAIYLSKLLVCSVTAIFLNLIGILLRLVLGSLFFAERDIEFKDILIYTLCGSLFLVALSAIYMVIPMFMQSKSSGIVITMSAAFILLIAILVISLERMRHDYNVVYDYLYDILPTCQIYRVFSQQSGDMLLMSGYAVLVTIVFTALGIFGFKKRDMK